MMGRLLVALLALGAISPGAAWGQSNVLTQWQRQYYGQWEGARALLHNGSYHFGKLAFGDLDGDGLQDLMLGKRDGTIALFSNKGKAGRPNWVLVKENITSLQPPGKGKGGARTVVIRTGGHAAPALVDIDRDEDLDLFVGTADGRLMFYRNVGNPLLPAYSLVSDSFLSRFFGSNLVPAFADVDGNRSPDLIVGNLEGEVYWLPNQGTPRRAAYCVSFPPADALPDEDPPCRPIPKPVMKLDLENNAAPAMVDWDQDGDLDLFVGKSNGAIAYYENKGSVFQPDWQLNQKRFLAIDQGGFAAPAFFDVNGDRVPDMLIGSGTNNVSIYTTQGLGSVMDVWKMSGNFLNIQRLGPQATHVIITSGDLDADKDLDLIIGDRSGRMLWIENIGTASVPAWRVHRDDMIGTDREKSAPLLTDLDGDGDLDLLVGGLDGRLWFLRNNGSPQSSSFALESTNYASIDVGNDSVPAVQDIDNDGDQDLFVGNRQGFVIYYRNEGTVNAPDFRLLSTRFGELSVRLNASPSFFDWNGDKQPDLVIGSRDGALVLDVNKSQPKDANPKQWERKGNSWGDFRTNGYSAPHFADLNNDGKADLLIGDRDGNIMFWLNRGTALPTESRPAVATASVEDEQGGTADAGASQRIAGIPPAPDTGSDSGLAALSALEEETREVPSTEQLLLTAQEPEGPIPPAYVLASRNFGKIAVQGRATPAFGDIDGDEDLDLVVGSADGKLVYFRNEGSAEEAEWKKVTEKLAGFDHGPNPSPMLFDLDGDNNIDLLVGTEDGRVLFYRNNGSGGENPFTLVENALKGIRVGRSAAPAAALVNSDAHPDLVVGNFAGKLLAYVREGGAQSLNFTLHDRRYMGVDVGISSTPVLGDMNRDRQPDLLIGSDHGKIVNFVRTQLTPNNPTGWGLGPEFLKGIKFPAVSRPALADIDNDGDVDLLVGTGKGKIYFYRNDALGAEAPLSQ